MPYEEKGRDNRLSDTYAVRSLGFYSDAGKDGQGIHVKDRSGFLFPNVQILSIVFQI